MTAAAAEASPGDGAVRPPPTEPVDEAGLVAAEGEVAGPDLLAARPAVADRVTRARAGG